MGRELASGWHVAVKGTKYGPYEWSDLVAWAREGRFGPDDLVWQAELPGWTLARQVPGLFSTPGTGWGVAAPGVATRGPVAAGAAPAADGAAWPPGAPARRRRLSGMAIAAICLAVVIVLGGATTGIWLAVRGNGESATTDGSSTSDSDTVVTDALPEIKVEELSLGGSVLLPESTAISPESLTVLSNTGKQRCSASGDFELPAIHDEGSQTPIFAVNDEGNPVLMALVDSSTSDLQPSVASTARALVLYEPMILSLPPSVYDSVVGELESHPDLPALEATITDVLRSDASSPLDADAHPELYDQAARIEVDLLSDIIQIDEEATLEEVTGRVPLLLATTENGPLGPVALADTDTPFVEVIDDPQHSTTEVRLVNTTFAWYSATWTATNADGTTEKGWAALPRCALWRVDTDSVQVGWPPIGWKYDKLLITANGDLVFDFKRNQNYMMIDLAINFCALVTGYGGELLRKLDVSGSDLAALGNTYSNVVKAFKDFGALSARLQGQSFTSMATEVAGYFVANGVPILLAVAPLLKNEVSEEVTVIAERVITRRMAALASLSYGSIDFIAECAAFSNPSIASRTTGGTQKAGLYPLEAKVQVTPVAKDSKTYNFEAVVSGFPYDYYYRALELRIYYGDGTTDAEPITVEAGKAVVYFSHTYDGTPPGNVEAKLWTNFGAPPEPVLLVSTTVALSSPPTSVAGDPSKVSGTYVAAFNGIFEGAITLILDFKDDITAPGALVWVTFTASSGSSDPAHAGMIDLPNLPSPVTLMPDGSIAIGGGLYGIGITCTPSADGSTLTGTLTIYDSTSGTAEATDTFTATRTTP